MGTALDRHVALIGFMGAGKSTVGREVASRLEREFHDLDDEIEQATGKTIPELFAEHGEDYFRGLELTHLSGLQDAKPAVVALGGGAVTTQGVRDLLRRRAVTVLVDVDVETAWERAGGTDRPLARPAWPTAP